MIHHVSVGTNDIKRARAFYEPLMSLIGFRILKSSETAVHFGSSDIMFSLETPIDGLPATPGNGVHIAFQTPDRQTVRRFYESAIANGGIDEGAPGIRAPADVRLFKTISADTLAGQPRATLIAKPLPPRTLRMVLANPADAKANLAIRIRHAVSVKFDLRERTAVRLTPAGLVAMRSPVGKPPTGFRAGLKAKSKG
jgi:catechol 2,3-dioxygenase-like lactoylglutathione lyase family enzyme